MLIHPVSHCRIAGFPKKERRERERGREIVLLTVKTLSVLASLKCDENLRFLRLRSHSFEKKLKEIKKEGKEILFMLTAYSLHENCRRSQLLDFRMDGGRIKR